MLEFKLCLCLCLPLYYLYCMGQSIHDRNNNDSRRESLTRNSSSALDTSSSIQLEPKPNAFVTFHIHSPQLVNKVVAIGDELLHLDKRFEQFLQPIHSLHVTVIVVRLESPEDFHKAKTALRSAASLYRKFLKSAPLRVYFKGLGTFEDNRTLFVDVQKGASSVQLHGLYDVVTREFESRGIPSLGRYPSYHPHMTVVQLHDGREADLKRYILERVNSSISFGAEKVKVLQLCSMPLDPDSKDYKVIDEVRL